MCVKNLCIKNNNLPIIPNELISSLEEIEKLKNCFPDKDFNHTYASYEVPNELDKFLQNFFDYPIVVRYQVIKKKLPIHIDVNTKAKFNYLIKSGGNQVTTRWWDDDKNPTKKLQECEMKELEWYYLKVDVPHDISEIENTRISITIKINN
jgi:hypothetical protein